MMFSISVFPHSLSGSDKLSGLRQGNPGKYEFSRRYDLQELSQVPRSNQDRISQQ